MNSIQIQQLLERMAGALRSEVRARLVEFGIQPVQFEVLQYLAMCNRYSDTPMAVTEYLGQTKGTVSQTLKVLENKGLVEKISDANDKRQLHLSLTSEGQALVSSLQHSPMIEHASQLAGPTVSEGIASSLMTLLTAMQRSKRFKSFGQCAQCRHHIVESEGQRMCGLTQEALSDNDADLICREHELKD